MFFERKDEVETPGFSVDILMDASSSRKQMQQKIAAQAYVLSKSLTNCGNTGADLFILQHKRLHGDAHL